MKEDTKLREVLVTTEYRGVFFGSLVEHRESEKLVELKDVRMAIRFGTHGGVLELAELGPNASSFVGSTAPSATLHGVTGVFDVTEEAAKQWRSI